MRVHDIANETVSMGDTAISNSGVVKTQSAKICLNFNGSNWVKLWIGILGKMSKNFASPESGSPGD